MALKPFYQIDGSTPKPQFLLKDREGREFGVVEHYETDRAKSGNHMLLEFFSPDPSFAKRPLLWVDLEAWSVLVGHGKNLPDADFEAGLDVYLQSWSETDRDLRRARAKKAHHLELIKLAEEGMTIAYQEMFPGELKREDFPSVKIGSKDFLVDDQYLIQPGDFRNQVTLVFIEDKVARSGGSAKAGNNPAAPGNAADEAPRAALLCNWLFGQGYEILDTTLNEQACHKAIQALTENRELEKIYRERLTQMRREGTLLGVKPKPYQSGQGSQT